MRILALQSREDLNAELARVGVDAGAWPIFAEKSRALAVKLDSLSVATANILKQTALLCGADCAVHRSVVSGKVRRSDAVLFATPRQLAALCDRLKGQPECAARLAPVLAGLHECYHHPGLVLKLGSQRIDLGRRTHVMGVLNVTPDSFSDGGRFIEPARAVEHGLRMAEEGADFIDVGAESTRPGARPVPAAEQARRLRPVLRGLARQTGVPLSVDTMSAAVAEEALDQGAKIVNDISGLGADRRMAKVVARAEAACVVMHMKGRPRTMQRDPNYSDLMGEIHSKLEQAVARATDAGVGPGQVVVDPGVGFGKTAEHNFEILRRLSELRSLGRPILVGPSRKSFIGKTLNLPPEERLAGTLAACVLAARNGANVVRVHDVKAAKEALLIGDRVAGR